MRILMLSQVFWPDTASVAQHLQDFAEELQKKDHIVSVYSSRNSYEDTSIKFLHTELHKGIRIERLRNTSFGKKSSLGRVSDFFTFNFILFFKLITIRRNQYDLIFGTTSPPLVSFIGLMIARLKKIPFCYWTMDLQPELAIASGMMKEKSIISRVLTYMGNSVIKNSNLIFTLDKYMKNHLLGRGAVPDITHVLSVWPVMHDVYNGARVDNPFRIEHRFANKIVIMYSGNHSYVHPIDTLLRVAHHLRTNDRFLFVFIGEGVRKNEVTLLRKKHTLENIIQLPYQPRNNIHNSLGAADIQVVIMGNGQVGYTHPNKVYGAMFIGKPILYIGPDPSHVTDILNKLEGNIIVGHGEDDKLINRLLNFEKLQDEEVRLIGSRNQQYAREHFYPDHLKEKMVQIIEQQNFIL